MSEKKINIYQKLNNFNTMVGAIRKDKTNPYHKSKYADINDVLEAIREPLSTNGLVALQTTIRKDDIFYLNTKIINIDNPEEFVEIDIPLLYQGDMQKLGSAITYARRYGLVTLLNLEQEDDDGNKAEGLDKENANKQNNKQQHPKPNNNNQNTAEILKNKKKELSSYLKIKGIPIDAQPNFIEFLKSKNYDVNDLTKLVSIPLSGQLVCNRKICDKFKHLVNLQTLKLA